MKEDNSDNGEDNSDEHEGQSDCGKDSDEGRQGQ